MLATKDTILVMRTRGGVIAQPDLETAVLVDEHRCPCGASFATASELAEHRDRNRND